jgi:hypothetical protein
VSREVRSRSPIWGLVRPATWLSNRSPSLDCVDAIVAVGGEVSLVCRLEPT